MAKDFRYKMAHIGDIFVDKMLKGIGSIKTSTRGIVLTYDLHELEKKRKRLLTRIGQRLEEVRKSSPESEIFTDEQMAKLFSELRALEENIEACRRERVERLNPKASVSEPCAAD